MAEKYPLSEGSLRVIMTGGQIDEPIMQVLGSKKIASSSSDKERFRILLSDGKYLISFAMLTTQINKQVVSGELSDFSIIKIKRYITSVINNAGKGDKRVLVILDMEMLLTGDKVGERLGNPAQLPENDMEGSKDSPTNMNGNKTAPTPRPHQSTSYSHTSNISSMDTSTLDDQITHPISSLSPYQNKWVIKARVTNKSAIRTWSNSKGEGKLFSVDFLDESGEIKATAFRDAVDKFYDMLQIDKVYYISKCQLKLANKQFATLKNDYEMTFTNDTIVQECNDAAASVPMIQYNFVTIDKIGHMEVGTIIDVIAICKTVSELNTFQAKSTGRELKKREVTLVDQSTNSIALTLWGTDAENFDGSTQPVIIIKGAKVNEFGGGKNISTLSSSVMKINPDIPESHKMRGWFDNEGVYQEYKNISMRSGGGSFQTQWMSIREVQDNHLGNSDKGDYYQVKANVLFAKSDNIIYQACPTEECNKKVIDLKNGMYRCEKCNREYPNFKYRLLANMSIGDWSGSQWISMFSSEAEKILGMEAQKVGEASESDPESLAKIVEKAHFREFIFKCRVKTETYNDEPRLKTVAVKVEPVNYKEYNAYLISKINEFH